MTYYSQRKSIKDGTPQAVVNKYGDKVAMEYQFHLFCASAVKNEADNDLDAIEWGTVEGGVIERKKYAKPTPEPEEVVEE